MRKRTASCWLLPAAIAAVTAATASAQIGISASATGFTDISGTGTSVGAISDDSEFNITAAALAGAGFTGNGLLGVANVRVGNNGGVIWDPSASTNNVGYINSTTLPAMATSDGADLGNAGVAPARQFLAVLWDDNTPGTGGSCKWQVIGGNLYIQWTNEDHFNATGVGTVTYEMIVYSGVTIASQLPLVEYVYNDTLYAASQYQNDGGSSTIGYKNWGVVAAANDVEFGVGGGNNTIGDPAFGGANMQPKVGGIAANANPLLPHSVVIKGQPPAPPANDACGGAFNLAATQFGDTTLANFSAASSCDLTGKDVWYKYTNGANAGTLTLDTCTSATDAVISVYDVCAGTELACDDNSAPCGGNAAQVAIALAASQSIVIRVSDKGTSGPFVLHSGFVVPPPSNDECTGATAIGPGSTSVPANNTFATPASGAPASACQSSQSRDIWFLWTSQGAGSVQVNTCGASQPVADSVVTIYTGSCGGLTEIACDDDTCTTPGNGSQVTFTAACTTAYYIRLSMFSTGAGQAWTLNVIAPGFTDTDGDGFNDCVDGCPADPTKQAPGICGCGIADTDSDGDGTADCIDGCPADPNKTAPGACGCGVADTDGDGDGTPDCIDGCPADPNKTAPGVCGCGVADTDGDGDGTPDCIDGCPADPNKVTAGVCGCGVADTDSDGDGTADCIDGCPADPAKIAAGACGCGNPDTDTDGDGIADCNDNCDNISNPGQGDCDVDGIGDACEIAAGATDTDGNGVPDSCQLGSVFTYCTAGTTTHNCNASMSAVGVPSASASSGFVITCNNIEGQKFGLMFYGVSGPTALPWGNGTSFLCVKPPTQRLLQQSSGGVINTCSGSMSNDFNAYAAANPTSVGMPRFAGEVVDIQTWFRDPPAPKTTNLSNGLQFTFAP